MKKTVSILLSMLMLFTVLPAARADGPVQNAVSELCSIDGYYVDDVGNQEVYSYHVPQINADTPAAAEINAEIAESFGKRVEDQFRNMEGGYSLWMWNTEWEAFWNGSQVFLLITAEEEGDLTEYGAYGYDFETGSRVTNSMILEQKGLSEEQYLEKLREAVSALAEELYRPIPEAEEAGITRESLLEETLGWLSADQPMFLNRFGEIETWAAIATPAGAGRYDRLVTLADGEVYAIRLTGDPSLVESCPETAKAGETVTVRTCDVTDGELEVSVIGAEVIQNSWPECRFVMPDHDIEVHVVFIGNGLA